MLDANQINTAKNRLAPLTIGGKNTIGHVAGETADILTFPSENTEDEIRVIAKALGGEFGYKNDVAHGTLPLGGKTWYQVQFT